MQQIDHILPWSACGTQRTLSLFRFGNGPRKAYIQASLHADELPGMRVAVALKSRLAELEAQGRLKGVIELVPLANPIESARCSRPHTKAVSSSTAARTSTAIFRN